MSLFTEAPFPVFWKTLKDHKMRNDSPFQTTEQLQYIPVLQALVLLQRQGWNPSCCRGHKSMAVLCMEEVFIWNILSKTLSLNFPRGCQGNSTPGQQLWRWKEPYFCFLNLLPTASPLGNAIAAAITVRLEQVALGTGQCTAAPVLCPCSGLGQLRPLHIPQRGSPGSLLSAGRAGLCEIGRAHV